MTFNFNILRLLQCCIAVPGKYCSSRLFVNPRGYRLLQYCNDPYIYFSRSDCSDSISTKSGAV